MKGFSKERLMKIGQEVASSWGAVCVGIQLTDNSVIFECNEFGEQFVTELSFDEIRDEYSYIK